MSGIDGKSLGILKERITEDFLEELALEWGLKCWVIWVGEGKGWWFVSLELDSKQGIALTTLTSLATLLLKS